MRKQGPNRPLAVPWDHKSRGVGFIGANSGVVTAQAASNMFKKIDDAAVPVGRGLGLWGPTALLVLAPWA